MVDSRFKFRAWNGKKIIDNIAVINGCAAVEENPIKSGCVSVDDTDGKSSHYYSDWAKFNKKDWPIMQFIGAADSVCADIYEGDIIIDHVGVGEVIYSESNCAFKVSYFGENKGLGKWFTDYLPRECKSVKVIGNIYQNPELIENNN